MQLPTNRNSGLVVPNTAEINALLGIRTPRDGASLAEFEPMVSGAGMADIAKLGRKSPIKDFTNSYGQLQQEGGLWVFNQEIIRAGSLDEIQLDLKQGKTAGRQHPFIMEIVYR